MAKFTVEDRGGCVIVYDPIPIAWVARFAGMIEGAVIATDLARMLGASFVFGSMEHVDKLIAEVKPEAERRALAENAGSGLSAAARLWLVSGERGISSNTMFTVLTGLDVMDRSGRDHPYDPADFRRCRLLLDQCPELVEHLPKMGDESKEWSGLVQNWDAICLTMDAENPDWREKRGSYPHTYELIKQAIGRK